MCHTRDLAPSPKEAAVVSSAGSVREVIEMDLLHPLPKTRSGNQYVLVFTERYTKLTRAIGVTKVTNTYASFVVEHWIISYGASTHLLSDNGPNSSSASLQPPVDTF